MNNYRLTIKRCMLLIIIAGIVIECHIATKRFKKYHNIALMHKGLMEMHINNRDAVDSRGFIKLIKSNPSYEKVLKGNPYYHRSLTIDEQIARDKFDSLSKYEEKLYYKYRYISFFPWAKEDVE